MTQHALQEDILSDQQIMRRLAMTIGGFVVFTALLAVVVGIIMG